MVWEAFTGVKEQSGVMDILGSFKLHFEENVHVGRTAGFPNLSYCLYLAKSRETPVHPHPWYTYSNKSF